MSDEKIQELKRRVASGDEDAKQALLRERARFGEIKILEVNGKIYELRPWYGGRGGIGRNRACDCKDLMQVVGRFCVCEGQCWCPTHGGPRCVGSHS